MAFERNPHTVGIAPRHLAANKILIILGNGPPMPDCWSLLARALCYSTTFDACVINDNWEKLPYLKHVRHWFTQHPELFHDTPGHQIIKHTIDPRPDTQSDASQADFVWPMVPIGDSSLIATILALDVWGYDKVILTGVPLSYPTHSQFRPCWEAQCTQHKDRITSTHGWPMKHFGYPTEQWVKGDV